MRALRRYTTPALVVVDQDSMTAPPRRPSLALLVAMLAVTACDKTPAQAEDHAEAPPAKKQPAPSSTTTEPAPAEAPAPEKASRIERAEQVLAWLTGEEFGKLRPWFDAAMAKAFDSDEALARWWKGILAQTGPFQKVRRSATNREGTTTTVVLTAYFGTAAWDVSVVFDAEDKVAGLSVLASDYAGLRPQTPKDPLPYTTREVRFEGEGGTAMGGTLSIPESDGPHPAVVLISGSGSHDRDATVSGHRPFFVLADHLTRNGFAVLRYDDRGVGASKGDPTQETVPSVAADAKHAVQFVAGQPEVDAARVGVVGHSVGGMVAPGVATAAGAAFVVALAGPSLPGVELIPLQVGTLTLSEGHPADVVDEIVAEQRILVEKIAAGAAPDELEAALVALGKASAKLVDEPSPGVEKALTAALRTKASQPWYPSFVNADPASDLKALRLPVLMLYAEHDVVIPAAANETAANTALAANRDAQVRTLSGLNHLFQPAKVGGMKQYVLIEQTLDPEVLRIVTSWLREHAGLEGGVTSRAESE